jgi:hypothetical protein
VACPLRKRTQLELFRAAKPLSERPPHAIGDGQGSGRRIQHQRNGVGVGPQERLGFLCLRGGRRCVELSVRFDDLPPP